MTLQIDKANDNIIIYLQDKFDFSSADDFKNAYENNEEAEYTVDFRDTNYMDSSGLGILLNMKRSVGDKKISLINCKSQIKKVLIISRFDEQFDIT
ncbi:MAG: STAS domain-containing protein [Cellvibrionaceae bacterium]